MLAHVNSLNLRRRCAARGVHRAMVAAALVGTIFVSSSAGQTILLDDTFADGSRTETNLPTESAVYVGLPSGAAVEVDPGALQLTIPGSSTKMWTHFAPHDDPVVLNVGERLIANVSFIPRETLYANSSRSFRMGLFYDPTGGGEPNDGHVEEDVNSDGGGSGNPWQDSTGYGVNIPLNNNEFIDQPAPFDISKRINTNNSLIGSGGAFTFSSSGGDPVLWELDKEYTLTYEIHHFSNERNRIVVSLSDETGVLSTHTAIDDVPVDADPGTFGANNYVTGSIATSDTAYNTYSHLMFRFSNNTQVADQLDFTRVQVLVDAIPEPSTALLGFMAALGSVLLARRRR